MNEYNHKEIETKWQKQWEKDGLYKTGEDKDKPKFYVLDMFPYPSGAGLHVGHPKGYIATDVFSRMKMMQGFNVLHPMGWDAFGLPAENYALANKTHPKIATDNNIAIFKAQLEKLGFSYDWDREIKTTDPEFYKWTQWAFLKMFERGLAYESYEPINWCPSCQTGLANEDLEDGKCERCGSEIEQKPMRQWVLKITDYADRMLNDLDKLPDWEESIKEMQRNWIGRSEGASVKFQISNDKFQINSQIQNSKSEYLEVFTTRPDTLFGCTYMVVAPEHSLIKNEELRIKNYKEVEEYILEAKKKTSLQRTELNKEKTGVKLEGIMAINPVNGEEIPVYIADYVMMGYGTGAIMAVPAHDERDFEFAKKYSVNIREVVAKETGTKTGEEIKKRGGCAIVFDPKAQKYAVIKRADGLLAFYSGGANEGENLFDCVQRELKEESGFYNYDLVEQLGHAYTNYYNSVKKHRVCGLALCNLVVLKNNDRLPLQLEDHEKEFETVWVTPDEMLDNWLEHSYNDGSLDHWRWFLNLGVSRLKELGIDKQAYKNCYIKNVLTENGVAINSGFLDGLKTEEAKKKMVEWLEEKGLGKLAVNYKLKDWVFSRQRYWGEPIPIVHCEKCGTVAVPEKDLPVTLPEVERYELSGTGESPLATISDWVNTTCPKCGGPAKRETNTMPQWAGSSWYYLRYIDPHNDKALVDKAKEKYWSPVDFYVGGAEHATRHLIYARFWHKFLFDIGAVAHAEPFKRLQHVGLVMAEDGRKMSKRWGNVINPDDVVAEHGADAMRVYEMFMGPFSQSVAWNTKGLTGARKFLERVWKTSHNLEPASSAGTAHIDDKKIINLLHKTIRKVSEDIEGFKLNTAVSQMMIFMNNLEKESGVSRDTIEKFLLILSPFAPHMTEELWSGLGHKTSIFKEAWPKFDPALVQDDMFALVLQINGKLRDSVSVSADISEDEAKKIALENEKVRKWVEGKEIVKVIYVKGKLVNVVVK